MKLYPGVGIRLNLNSEESATFQRHLLYMCFEGVILGVLALNEFVFIKSLKGSNLQLGFLFQFSMIIFLFLILVNEFLKRVHDRRKLLRRVALITRLPLVLVFFFPRGPIPDEQLSAYHYVYLALFLIYFSGNIFIYPNINFLLKNKYRHQNFGRLYSYATSVNKIILLVVTFIYGALLDFDNFIFVYVIPVTGILGVVSGFILSTIAGKGGAENQIDRPRKPLVKSVRVSVTEMKNILLQNAPYRHFEAGFMLYGFSFMISVTVITIYFYEGLNLNYSSVAFYRNAYNILAIILLPFFGRLIGKIDPRKFAVFTYFSIVLYILSLMLTEVFPFHFEVFSTTIYPTLLGYVFFHGIFASTMVLLWNIGSAYFCKPEEAGTYQSMHLSLTGVRAIFSPLVGVLFYEMFGFMITFGLAVLSLVCAILLMIWSYKRDAKVSAAVANIE